MSSPSVNKKSHEIKFTAKYSAIVRVSLDGRALAGDQGFQGSKKEGPERFVVSFGGHLYMVRIWVGRLLLVAKLIEYGE